MASSSAFSTSSKNVKILLNEKVTQVISWILISSNKDILQDVLFFRWISNFSCCAVTNFCSSRWLKFLLGNNLQHTLEAAEHSQERDLIFPNFHLHQGNMGELQGRWIWDRYSEYHEYEIILDSHPEVFIWLKVVHYFGIFSIIIIIIIIIIVFFFFAYLSTFYQSAKIFMSMLYSSISHFKMTSNSVARFAIKPALQVVFKATIVKMEDIC